MIAEHLPQYLQLSRDTLHSHFDTKVILLHVPAMSLPKLLHGEGAKSLGGQRGADL